MLKERGCIILKAHLFIGPISLVILLIVSGIAFAAKKKETLSHEHTSTQPITQGVPILDSSKKIKNKLIRKDILKLNLAEAINIAINSNRDLQISTLDPYIAQEEKKSTEAVYDPTFFAENNFYKTDRPIHSILDTGTDGSTGKDSLVEDGWNARAGFRKPLPTGGIASLFLEADHLDSNSELVLPNPQYTSRLTLQLRQALLKEFGDKSNKSNIERAGLNVKIAEAQYKKSLGNVLRDVAAAYWRFTYYFQQQDISREAVASGNDIYQRLKSREESGLANLLDIDRAKASIQDRKRSLLMDARNFKTSMDQLKLLIGISPGSETYRAGIVPTEHIINHVSTIDREVALQQAFGARPEILIARLKTEAAEIEKKLAKHKKLPTLDAKASYSFNALGEDVDDTMEDVVISDQGSWGVGLEFEWPIGGRETEADYQKAILKQRKRQMELRQSFEQVGYEVHSTSNKIEELAAEIEATLRATEAYERVLKREGSLFEIDRVDNQRLLDAQDDYYQAQKNTLKSILNLNIALLDLSWAKGTLLDELEIDFRMVSSLSQNTKE